MATAENANEYSISSDAMGVMDCFSDSMGQIVYKMAGLIAAKREPSPDDVVITISDIEDAVNQIAEIMRNSDLPDGVIGATSSMLKCCSDRIREVK